jgi:hypothetical protein
MQLVLRAKVTLRVILAAALIRIDLIIRAASPDFVDKRNQTPE